MYLQRKFYIVRLLSMSSLMVFEVCWDSQNSSVWYFFQM